MRTIDTISEVKGELFEAYCLAMDVDSNRRVALKQDFGKYMRYRVRFMPYWMILELQSLGFNLKS